MLTHSAKTRVPSQMTAANVRSRTTSHTSQKLNTCANTANAGFDTMRNGQDLRMGSRETSAICLYGNTHRYIVRQKPSEVSLLGSPSWSENVWCRRCRFTHVTGLT